MPKVFEAPPGFVVNPDYLVPELRAQRDALLEKIKAVIAAEQSEGAGRGGFVNTPPTREHQRRVAQAWKELHAAIKTVEGEMK